MGDTVLVTGANRGIGLEIARALLDRGHRVVACCRDPDAATALAALAPSDGHAGDGAAGARLEVRALDVGDGASVAALAEALAGRPLDALVNNAGRMRREAGAADVNHDDWTTTFAINAQGPLRVATALKANLAAGSNPRVLTVSSQLGSIERATAGSIAYRSSKAAVNMAMRCLADEWSDDGIAVCTVHPGWVRTDMGGSEADLSPAESAADLVDLLERLTIADTGRFLNHDGSPLPW